MPKYEIYTTDKEPQLPSADNPQYKKLVAEAPYHPGYEGAAFDSITIDNIKPLSTDQIISLNIDNLQTMATLTTNTNPSPQNITFDWNKITVSNKVIAGGGTSGGSAMKFDGDKLPVNLLSSEALNQTAAVLKFGADKYHAHNWRDGFAWSRPLAAAMRHIMAFNDGEDKDPESGLSHLAHAACCIMFLLEFEKTHPELDDRYKVDVSNTNKTSK
jgi:hypothetical protein